MNIDLELLAKQKLTLLHKIETETNETVKEDLIGILHLLDWAQDVQEDKFPNGLSNWIETHHEIVSAIALNPEDAHNKVNDIEATKGTGGLYEFAEALTDKFEQEHKGTNWGEQEKMYFETLEEFLQTEFDNS